MAAYLAYPIVLLQPSLGDVYNVCLSMKLDKKPCQKLKRRSPAEWAHGKKIRTAHMCVKLNSKIMERIKAMGIVKPLPVLAVGALDFTVVARRV